MILVNIRLECVPAAPNSVLPADARSVLTTEPEVRSDNWKQQTRKGGQFGKKSKGKAASGSKVSRRTEQVSEEPANTTQGSCSAVLPNDSALPKHIQNSVHCDAVCALLPTPTGQPLQGVADAVQHLESYASLVAQFQNEMVGIGGAIQ